MGKSIAKINGKDVTSDWMDDVFDECNCAYGNRKQSGYVNDDLVEVSWDSETFTWKVFSGKQSTIAELKKRLLEMMEDYPEESPKLTTEITVCEGTVYQQYFWEDNTEEDFSNEQLNEDFRKWWSECKEEGDDPESLFEEYMKYLRDSRIISSKSFANAKYIPD